MVLKFFWHKPIFSGMSNTTVNLAANVLNLSKPSQTDASAAAKVAAQKSNSATVAPVSKPSGVKGDQTTLSLASKLITTALAGSDVRTEKVASLQKAIASGSYNVSSSDVADKLLTSLLG